MNKNHYGPAPHRLQVGHIISCDNAYNGDCLFLLWYNHFIGGQHTVAIFMITKVHTNENQIQRHPSQCSQ